MSHRIATTYDNGVQNLQALQYEFPYHYIPQPGCKIFLSRQWQFADSYMAALGIVANRLRSMARTSEFHHIDIGCGDGALIYYLSHLPGLERATFTGADIDERSIAWARMFNPGVEFHNKKLEDISGRFTSASMIEVIEHVPPHDLPSFLEVAANLLVPNALMLVTVPSVEKPVAKKHFQHFSFDSLRTVLEHRFEIEQLFGFERKDFLTKTIGKLRINRFFRLDSPILNRLAVTRLGKIYEMQKGCGRLLVVCRQKN